MDDAGEEVRVDEGVVVTTFSSSANRLAGARFRFWGLQLLPMLNDGPTGQIRAVYPSSAGSLKS